MAYDAANSPVLAAYRAYVQLLARLRLPPGLHACFDLNAVAEGVLRDTCGESGDASHLPCELRRCLVHRAVSTDNAGARWSGGTGAASWGDL